MKNLENLAREIVYYKLVNMQKEQEDMIISF